MNRRWFQSPHPASVSGIFLEIKFSTLVYVACFLIVRVCDQRAVVTRA